MNINSILNIVAVMALVYLVYFVVYWFRVFFHWAYDPPHTGKVVEDAKSIQKRLEQKGLDYYLRYDFGFKNILTGDDLKTQQKLEQKMTAMMNDILRWLKLTPDMKLRVVCVQQRKVGDAGGTYDHNNKLITINFYKKDTPDTLTSVLCHECTHCFLYRNGLFFPDSYQTERFTDITSCLLGFSYYRIHGSGRLGKTKIASQRGYLKKDEFAAINRYLRRFRKQAGPTTRAPEQKTAQTPPPEKKATPTPPPEQHKQTAAQTQQPDPTPELREQLNHHLAGADAMLQQAKDVLTLHKVPTRTDLTPQDYDALKRTVDQLTTGAMSAELQACRAALGQDAQHLRQADQTVMRICEDLSRVMNAFR
ncbi:MAG: hypothetical protein IJ662_09100 [Clostridia bacterium]|nr:hypothetical protein [Clostridia bacterium]